MMRDRDRALVELMRSSLPPSDGWVLDLGSGDGRLARVAHDAGLPIGSWVGVDLDPEAAAAASAAMPWASFLAGSADALPFDAASFHVVVASTLFSSLPSVELEQSVAAEVARVLAPGGWLVWYDLRYHNPANRAVHGINAAHISSLFPGWNGKLRATTLLPPVARRLGPLTKWLYAPLETIAPFRSHLIGRICHP